MKTAPGQLDMFAAIEHAEAEARLAATPPCMFNSPARGLAARAADWDAWVAQWGNFGSRIRSHAWTVGITAPKDPTSRCQATVLDCSVRRERHGNGEGMPACDCVEKWDDLLYRGACTGCAWEGDPRRTENTAVEDAMDHAWPGWRDLPIVPRWPDDTKKQARWWEKNQPLFPEGWLEQGGPIRTYREKHATRHHAGHCHPYRGYDLGVAKPETEA